MNPDACDRGAPEITALFRSVRQRPGLSAPMATLGLVVYGFVVGLAANALWAAWGPFPGLLTLAVGATLGLMVIVSGNRGIH